MVELAIFLTLAGLIACAMVWRRWKAPTAAKVLVCIAIMGLGVPGTCMGIGFGAFLFSYHGR